MDDLQNTKQHEFTPRDLDALAIWIADDLADRKTDGATMQLFEQLRARISKWPMIRMVSWYQARPVQIISHQTRRRTDKP